jgi:hypothetical protein
MLNKILRFLKEIILNLYFLNGGIIIISRLDNNPSRNMR